MTKSTNEGYGFETTLNLRQRKIIIYNTYDEDSTSLHISLEYYARYRIDIRFQARLHNDDKADL